MRLNFIIADDHPLFRGAMKQVLMSIYAELDLMEAGDFETVRKFVSGNEDIDLLLLDIAMPGSPGLPGLMMIKSIQPALPVVIVSASDDESTIKHAFHMGASGFISKSAGMEQIGEAVRHVLAGDLWFPEGIDSDHVVDNENELLLARIRSLTPQQMRVLSMLGEGLLNKQIAYELDVSEATVKAHVSAILQKLSVDSRTQAVILFSKIGGDIYPIAS